MPRPSLRVFSLVSIFVFGAACSSTPNLAPKGPTTNLSGRWTLERHTSDNVRDRLLAKFDREDRRWRKVEDKIVEVTPTPAEGPPRPVEPNDNRPPPEGVSNIQWMQRQRQREAEYFISLVAPASNIEIQQGARELRFSSDKGQGSRSFIPGRRATLFIAVGGFDVNSGWMENSYLIQSSGTGDNEMDVTELYTLLDDGRLEERLTVRVPGIGKESFRFFYRRAP